MLHKKPYNFSNLLQSVAQDIRLAQFYISTGIQCNDRMKVADSDRLYIPIVLDRYRNKKYNQIDIRRLYLVLTSLESFKQLN